MKGYNKPKNVNIEQFLTGTDDEKYIRDVSVSNFTNVAKVFIREPEAERFTIKEYKFTPYLWSKELPDDVKKDFFKWKTIGVPLDDYSKGSEFVILDGKKRKIDNEKVKYLGITPDDESHIFSWELETEEERLDYYRQKKNEYGVEIEELITYYHGEQQIERMEKGYKYMVKIKNQQFPKYSSNPLFCWSASGKKIKITGSFNNLVNFYLEGGLNVYQKAGDHINKELLYDKFNGLKKSGKLLFFLDIINDLKELELNFFSDDFYDRDETFKFIKANDEILEALKNNLDFSGEDIKISKVNTLKLLKYVDARLLLETAHKQKKVDTLFPDISLDEEKIDRIVSDNKNFRLRSVGGFLVEKLKNNNFNFFDSYEKLFYTIPIEEQFMIQSGKRLFKGIENYDDLRIMTLDIETEARPEHIHHPKAALEPEYGRVFKIGIYINNGFQKILEAKNDEEEFEILTETYRLIGETDPDLFLTYNGEGFDIPFMEKRLEMLGGVAEDKNGEVSAEQYIRNILKPYFDHCDTYINDYSLYNRRRGRLKVGGASELYTQTYSLGRAICDTMFAVKRAQAQNNKIPNLKLKDNIIFADVAKPNRVYIQGNKIGELENDKRDFYINEKTGHYFANNKTISFYQADYTKEDIKTSKNGDRYFLTNKKLFLYTEKETKQNQEILKRCKNAIGVSFYDQNGKVHESFEHFKKIIDENFKKLHSQMSDYDILVAPISGVGLSIKESHPKHFQYLLTRLKGLRDDFKDVKKMFSDVNLDEYIKTTGSDIVKRYLIDDLWETYELDKIYSQATFSVAKWIPTTYQRAATMGTATIWKQLLTAWSYMHGLGIPDYEKERDFNGGLVGMVSSGFHKDIVKIDYSSLYPSKFLTDVDTPDIDISGVFKDLLLYALETRLKFKGLKNEAISQGNFHDAGIFDKKQLPLKIIINSFYGMLGAPNVSPFAHIDSAHHITAGSRQGMRHVIRWFGNRKFKVVYFHTDGANFVIPKGVQSFTYIGKGKENGGNWLVEAGKKYTGVEAYVAKYNDTFMKGLMGVDIDEYAESCINFSKGNFVYLKHKKNKKTGEIVEVVDYVGGAIVKKNQSQYIKDFLFEDEYDSLKILLRGDLSQFVNNYYKYLYKIIDHEIQAKKIASKARVTKDIATYKAESKVRQAHMELAIQHNLSPKVGDWIFYINIGENASDSDFTVDKEKVGNLKLEEVNYVEMELYLEKIFKNDRNKLRELIYDFIEVEEFTMSNRRVEEDGGSVLKEKFYLLEDIENWADISFKHSKNKSGEYIELIRHKEIMNSKLVTEEDLDESLIYNTEKYVNQFNSAIAPLWVAFEPHIREEVITNKKGERPIYLEGELKPCNGIPLEAKQDAQDELNDLLKTEEIEKQLWVKKGYSPFWAFTRESFNPNGYFRISDEEKTYKEISKNEYETKNDESFLYVDAKGLVDWLCDNPFVDYDTYPVKQLD